jgi:flagellar assembly factor FliW
VTEAPTTERRQTTDIEVLETPFGLLRREPERTVRLPNGLFGFPSAERFQLDHLPGPGSALRLLQSVDEAGLSFIVLPVAGDGELIARCDLEPARLALGIPEEDLLVLLIVTTTRSPDGLRLFANLRAPLLIDGGTRTGAQVVLANPDYPVRHPLDAA